MLSSRHYLTFSLRTLFVLLTLFAVWTATIVNRAREQREAVKAIEALGGVVVYDWQPNVKEWIGGTPPREEAENGPPAWYHSELFQKVDGVIIPGEMFFDDLIDAAFVAKICPHLRRLPWLNAVHLEGNQYVPDEIRDQFRAELPDCEVYSP